MNEQNWIYTLPCYPVVGPELEERVLESCSLDSVILTITCWLLFSHTGKIIGMLLKKQVQLEFSYHKLRYFILINFYFLTWVF